MQKELGFGNPDQKQAPAATAEEFTPAEICAIAGAFSGKRLEAAKAALKDGSNTPVDRIFGINGNVVKGISTTDKTTMVAAEVTYTGVTAMCALLRELGITPRKLRNALERLPALSAMQVDAEFTGIFDTFAQQVSDKLPQVPNTTRGKAGAVNVSVAVTDVKLEPASIKRVA